MFRERHNELVKTICDLLLEMLPEGATRIAATAEVDDDYAKSSLIFHHPSGQTGHFPFDHYPPEASDLNNTLIDLRDATLANGSDPWYGITLTVERDGRFDMNLSYEPLED